MAATSFLAVVDEGTDLKYVNDSIWYLKPLEKYYIIALIVSPTLGFIICMILLIIAFKKLI